MKHLIKISDYNIRAKKENANEDLMQNKMAVLLQLCKKNDRKAQRELFNHYKHKVYELIYKSLGPKFDIDDVLQQVFIELFKSLNYFKGQSSLDTWVYKIGSKICTTQLRKKYRKRQASIVYDSTQIDNDKNLNISEKNYEEEQKELEEVIYNALDKLEPEKRIVITLFEMEGRTLEEISEILNIPLGTVKSRLFHGRKILQKLLCNYIKE